MLAVYRHLRLKFPARPKHAIRAGDQGPRPGPRTIASVRATRPCHGWAGIEDDWLASAQGLLEYFHGLADRGPSDAPAIRETWDGASELIG